MGFMVTPMIYWGFLQFPENRPIKLSNPDPAKRNGLTLVLYFENTLGIQISEGETFLACPNDKMDIQLYHDHHFSLMAITPMLWKKWQFWRYKDQFKCWFCNECGITVKNTNITSSSNSSVDSILLA
jgi:hypothetical protein